VPEYVKYVADRDGYYWHYFGMWYTRKYSIRSMKYLAWLGISVGLATKFGVSARLM
jgi:hypothetical protein